MAIARTRTLHRFRLGSRACAILSLTTALAGGPACSAAGERYTKIDDMEGSGPQVAWTPPGASSDIVPGLWVSSTDVQCTDLEPPPTSFGVDRWSFADVPESYETLAGATSERAARLRTTAPLVNTWGASMGFDFTSLLPDAGAGGGGPDELPCPPVSRDLAEWPAVTVDLSAYAGVTFWGMADEEAGVTTIRFMFTDANTDPRGGTCDPTEGSPLQCWNSFGARVELSGVFTRYSIDFSTLEQDARWGYHPMPNQPDLEHAYGMAFQVDTPGGVCEPDSVCAGGSPELTFDVWIDDLYLVER